ncbi:probable disease resistance RPP8-like protein 4 isoform X2 [Macadamia integrifolia]|uniref:probable disease resistance RPP8-like protein 4 isoform X2 n=1 Tax=Macadamia integrifolia TaxID=60698 RepID=UPI001C4F3E70|nr:probable disease resistance RPP8-like protein 4 isoform X2 [Macadamia integrifolia]XP_042485893.1 probable disease resistance RPP8-like protein 4 isoform X2 [Macadamia integrifolia]XP_042485894.1 probable disease resistance RPP8-like protein 4 isoform X2 [Macadamia integrifolia]
MARTVLSSIGEFAEMINWERSHLETVDCEVQLICRELLAMKIFLNDEDGFADKEEVERWQDLQEIVNDAVAAIVHYVLRTASSRKRKPILKRYASPKDSKVDESFRKEITQISGRIKRLKARFAETLSHYWGGKSFNLSDLIRSSVDIDEEVEEDPSSNVVGLSMDKEELLDNALPKHQIISILGIQGIGKTTLAWEIYKSSYVRKHFQCKAWVCISAMDDDLSEIWKDIYKQINEFQQDKRYLIVIDDIGNPQVWRKLQEKIPQGGPGSRIILTTRDAGVACSAHYLHRSKVLSKAESWELFMKKLFIAPWRLGNTRDKDTTTESLSPFPLSHEMEALGKDMVEKCGGIPNLIIKLAKLLSTKDPNIVEWSCMLHGTDARLSQDQHPWFNLSYSVFDILPIHVKQFLHLFPIAKKIPERRLILTWAIEGGLWQQSNSVIPGEEAAAMRWMQDLQDLNLIQAINKNSAAIAKVYCISLDLPLVQILKAGGVLESSHDDDGKFCIHRIADHCNGEDPYCRPIHSNINSPHELETYQALRSLWCFNYPVGYKPGQEVGNFLKRCIHNNHLWFLRVLDLERVYKPSLPEAIGELINLRYLGLRWTFLDKLPSSVGNLRNLQTLDTKHTDIVHYPTIRNMQKLQHLYLNQKHHSVLVTQFSYLSDLQTLSGVVVDDDDWKDGLYKLTKLKKLRLTCQLSLQQKEVMVKWIGELENLGMLRLTSKDAEWGQRGEPATLSLLRHIFKHKQLSRMYLQGRWGNLYHHHDFGSNLTALTLSLTQLDTDPMPILEKLPKLNLLRLFSKSFIGKRMQCVSQGFLQLRVLKIWRLEKLEEWIVEDKAMPNLKELEIRSCKILKMLPNLPKTLTELKLTEMPKQFTSNIVMGDGSLKVAHVSSVIIEVWSHFDTSIELYTGQNRVFQEPLENLIDLQEFAVNLTSLTLSETKLKQDPMPVLEKLPKLMVLVLSSKSFTGNLMVCSKEGFRKLQQLTIRELEELEELTVENGAMPKLEELEIRSCKKLKLLPQILGTVKELKLANMPKEFTEKFKANRRVIVEDY